MIMDASTAGIAGAIACAAIAVMGITVILVKYLKNR